MIHVVMHILPQEIDHFEELMIHLKRCHIPKGELYIDVTLNLNFMVNEKSIIKKGFFVKKLKNIEKLTQSWTDCDFRADIFEVVRGCNDARRIAIRQSPHEWIMYLDADNVFSDTMMHSIIEATKILDHTKNFIICPEVSRMWDETWDVITNKDCMSTPPGHEYYDYRDPYLFSKRLGNDIKLRRIYGFKFAGWGTTIATQLARFIDIPYSLGAYGLDDTFIMTACNIMSQKGIPVSQYVLENEVIIENNKFRFNPYEDLIHSIDERKILLSKAQEHFYPELEKFKNRI